MTISWDSNSTPLAKTPPMGWNSWNAFGSNVDERSVMETADSLAESGLSAAGYEYVVIDDCWQGGRNADGYLFEDAKRFPGGMRRLSDYIHSKGLKFGIYSCAGERTCAGQPGSHRHEELDAALFASWEVDFLKYDYCYAPDDLNASIRRYSKMSAALKATGRPILFSICEWGMNSPWLWGARVGGHMWRVAFDVVDRWDSPENTSAGIGILTAIDRMAGLERHAHSGAWNDPDMLVVGLNGKGSVKGGGCTYDEYRAQMSMWCMLSAPLMIGCDIRKADEGILSILRNERLISLDRDLAGRQARRVFRSGTSEVWLKPLAGGSLAAAFLNRGENDSVIECSREMFGLPPGTMSSVTDLWTDRNEYWNGESLSYDVPPHTAKVVAINAMREA